MARHQETAAKEPLLAVTEATFGRHVLESSCPVLALFGTPACPASRALRPLLQDLASVYAGHIRVAVLNAERATFIAEQFGVQVTPTMLVMQDGEVVTRVVGFVPGGLLRLLCEQVATGTLPSDPFWSPTEATFEDAVLVPLLTAWGFHCICGRRRAPHQHGAALICWCTITHARSRSRFSRTSARSRRHMPSSKRSRRPTSMHGRCICPLSWLRLRPACGSTPASALVRWQSSG